MICICPNCDAGFEREILLINHFIYAHREVIERQIELDDMKNG